MGYYTHFELKWDTEDPQLDMEISHFLDENSETYYGLEPDGSCADAVKWYSYDDDMIEMSRNFPTVLFTLSGEGEEAGDLWKAYYKNSKSQRVDAKIVFPEPDLSYFD
jgi:hypothetical protein